MVEQLASNKVVLKADQLVELMGLMLAAYWVFESVVMLVVKSA